MPNALIVLFLSYHGCRESKLGDRKTYVVTFVCKLYCLVVKNLNIPIGCQLFWSEFEGGACRECPTGSARVALWSENVDFAQVWLRDSPEGLTFSPIRESRPGRPSKSHKHTGKYFLPILS